MKTVTLTELRAWLRLHYPKARQLSDASGITTAGAYLILDGETEPRRSTLEALGIEPLYRLPSKPKN